MIVPVNAPQVNELADADTAVGATGEGGGGLMVVLALDTEDVHPVLLTTQELIV